MTKPPKKLMTVTADKRLRNLPVPLERCLIGGSPCDIRLIIRSNSLSVFMVVLPVVHYLRDARFGQVKPLCQLSEAIPLLMKREYESIASDR